MSGEKTLTVAYVTARKEPHAEWFYDSLIRSAEETGVPLPYRLIMIYHHKAECWPPLQGRTAPSVSVFAPKPNVWNGKHRLTKEDWFAMASARNTAICLCQTTHLAFVDDLSVMLPSWLPAVWEAVDKDYIGLGVYQKVRKLQVENGKIINFEPFEGGMDDRLKRVDKDVSECDGGWLYGCSLVGPLEDFLEVGGFPEICDGLGSEDYCFGIALRNAGKHLKLDRRMMTLESEEDHFKETPFRRVDKGASPNDKSHAVLRIAQGSKYFPNFYTGGMRALRERVLNGDGWPTDQVPQHDWFDSQLIAEME